MRVCILVEGTYPYITGVVSSWIQMLIENMPDIEFDVVHLAPWKWTRPFGYKPPKNLKYIYEYLLFSSNYSKTNIAFDERELVRYVRQLIEIKEERAKYFANILRATAGKHIDY